MPRRRKYRLTDLPEPGTVFAMPLADGRTGVCRVLRNMMMNKTAYVLVAASDWVADEPPTLDDPAVSRILILTHHGWNRNKWMNWVIEPPPKEFRCLGHIDVTSEDTSTECAAVSRWNVYPQQVLTQWLWVHDRESVLAEDAANKALETASRAEASRKRTDYLSNVTFADLLAKDLFPTWDDESSRAAKEGCQRILQSFIRRLDAAPKPLLADFGLEQLKACVLEINQLDSEPGVSIETVEREDLCEVLEVVLNAAKLPDLTERIDDWRDW